MAMNPAKNPGDVGIRTHQTGEIPAFRRRTTAPGYRYTTVQVYKEILNRGRTVRDALAAWNTRRTHA